MVGVDFLKTKYNEMSVFVQSKSSFPCSREIAFIIVVIRSRQKYKKTNRLSVSINAIRSCYGDIKEASMSDCKWLLMRVTIQIQTKTTL